MRGFLNFLFCMVLHAGHWRWTHEKAYCPICDQDRLAD